jgi:hypothetical protein
MKVAVSRRSSAKYVLPAPKRKITASKPPVFPKASQQTGNTSNSLALPDIFAAPQEKARRNVDELDFVLTDRTDDSLDELDPHYEDRACIRRLDNQLKAVKRKAKVLQRIKVLVQDL